MALIQAIIIGFCLIIAGVPWAGALSAIVLVLGIAQLPALLVTLPAIVYIWSSGDYGNFEAILFSVLFIAGVADNILKPLLLGRGVEAPMPVILIGALGGMAAKGILGMFVGAILLALGYQIFMAWVTRMPLPAVCRKTLPLQARRVLDDHVFRITARLKDRGSKPGKCPRWRKRNDPVGPRRDLLGGRFRIGVALGWRVLIESALRLEPSPQLRCGGGWGSSLAVTGKWSEG